MGDWGEIVSFSNSWCKSAKMSITLAGALSEDPKMNGAKDNQPNFGNNDLKIVHFYCFYPFLDKNVPKMLFQMRKLS